PSAVHGKAPRARFIEVAGANYMIVLTLGQEGSGTDANHQIGHSTLGAGAQERIESLGVAAVKGIGGASCASFSICPVGDKDARVSGGNFSATVGTGKGRNEVRLVTSLLRHILRHQSRLA